MNITLTPEVFKVEKANAIAMVDGFLKNDSRMVRKRHFVSIFTATKYANSIRNGFLQGSPKLLFVNSSKRPEYTLSSIGKKIQTAHFEFEHKYKYIVFLDTVYKLKVNKMKFWEKICVSGLFDIWSPEAPFNSLMKEEGGFKELKNDPMILLIRIFEIDRIFRKSDLSKVSDFIMRIKPELSKKAKIIKPIISNDKFNKIRLDLEDIIAPYIRESVHVKDTNLILGGEKSGLEPSPEMKKKKELSGEEKFLIKVSRLLKQNKQIILQGPPGTGKTRLAKQLSRFIVKGSTEAQIDDLKGNVKLIQFHNSYSYEDFVRGIVAEIHNGNVVYSVQDKILAEMAKMALQNPDAPYVLIIDEINRANLSVVLGELIYSLEYRGEKVESLYKKDGSREIILSDNLYIIGTMNTADRSVGHIDYAIRRRFTFISILPDAHILMNTNNNSIQMKSQKYFNIMKRLFTEFISPEYEKDDVMLGHSYFMAHDSTELDSNMKYQVAPLLYEYVKDGILTLEAKELISSFEKTDM